MSEGKKTSLCEQNASSCAVCGSSGLTLCWPCACPVKKLFAGGKDAPVDEGTPEKAAESKQAALPSVQQQISRFAATSPPFFVICDADCAAVGASSLRGSF